MTHKEALHLALEALEMSDICADDCKCTRKRAINGIKAALVNEALERKAENARELGLDYEPLEAKDEPVETEIVTAEQHDKNLYARYKQDMKSRNWISFDDWLLETHPPQRTWVGLTNEEIDKAWRSVDYTVPWDQHRIDIARAIEAKLKELNT